MELTLPFLLWVVAFAFLLVSVLLGAILSYHWIRYAMNAYIASLAIAIYAAISGTLLVVLFSAVISYHV